MRERVQKRSSVPVDEASCHPGDIALSLSAMVTDAKNTPGFYEER